MKNMPFSGLVFFILALNLLVGLDQPCAMAQSCYTVDPWDCEDQFPPVAGPEWDLPCTHSTNICEMSAFSGLPTCTKHWVSYTPNGSYATWRPAGPGEQGQMGGYSEQKYCVIRTQCDCEPSYYGLPCTEHSSGGQPGTLVVNDWLTGAFCWGIRVED